MQSTFVSVIVVGSGQYESFTFSTTISSVSTVQNLHLKCLVASTTSTYVENFYPIKFIITVCSITSLYPITSTYVYNYSENGGLIKISNPVSNYFNGLTNNCYFNSCEFLMGSSTYSLVSVSVSGIYTSQMIEFATNTQNSFTI